MKDLDLGKNVFNSPPIDGHCIYGMCTGVSVQRFPGWVVPRWWGIHAWLWRSVHLPEPLCRSAVTDGAQDYWTATRWVTHLLALLEKLKSLDGKRWKCGQKGSLVFVVWQLFSPLFWSKTGDKNDQMFFFCLIFETCRGKSWNKEWVFVCLTACCNHETESKVSRD